MYCTSVKVLSRIGVLRPDSSWACATRIRRSVHISSFQAAVVSSHLWSLLLNLHSFHVWVSNFSHMYLTKIFMYIFTSDFYKWSYKLHSKEDSPQQVALSISYLCLSPDWQCGVAALSVPESTEAITNYPGSPWQGGDAALTGQYKSVMGCSLLVPNFISWR